MWLWPHVHFSGATKIEYYEDIHVFRAPSWSTAIMLSSQGMIKHCFFSPPTLGVSVNVSDH